MHQYCACAHTLELARIKYSLMECDDDGDDHERQHGVITKWIYIYVCILFSRFSSAHFFLSRIYKIYYSNLYAVSFLRSVSPVCLVALCRCARIYYSANKRHTNFVNESLVCGMNCDIRLVRIFQTQFHSHIQASAVALAFRWRQTHVLVQWKP